MATSTHETRQFLGQFHAGREHAGVSIDQSERKGDGSITAYLHSREDAQRLAQELQQQQCIDVQVHGVSVTYKIPTQHQNQLDI